MIIDQLVHRPFFTDNDPSIPTVEPENTNGIFMQANPSLKMDRKIEHLETGRATTLGVKEGELSHLRVAFIAASVSPWESAAEQSCRH